MELPVARIPVSRVAPLSLLIPVFGIASSALIVDEVPSGWEWLCIALILSALAVGMKQGERYWAANRWLLFTSVSRKGCMAAPSRHWISQPDAR